MRLSKDKDRITSSSDRVLGDMQIHSGNFPSRLSTLSLVVLLSLSIMFTNWYMKGNRLMFASLHRAESRLMTSQVVSRPGYDERETANDAGILNRSDANPVKKILVWKTRTFNKDQVSWMLRKLSRNVCSVGNCELVTNNKEFKTADAIVFELPKLTKDLPARRYPNQLYVVFSRECPDISNEMNGHMPSVVFNLTMTYRRDSDIFIPYGSVVHRATPLPEKDYWLTKNSSKMVSWLVSNCKTPGRREEFVRLLKKHVPVDIYGKCGVGGDKACGSRNGDWTQNCQLVYDDYMFYLAFENSICLDYVTEKMFYPLMHSTIPVVFGGADYATFAPPNSYIDALSFPGPEELAQYLKKVASNSTLYNSYHEWRQHYTAKMEAAEDRFCDLCAFLHGRTDKLLHPSKPLPLPEGIVGRVNGSYPDFRSWFFKGSRCTSWRSN